MKHSKRSEGEAKREQESAGECTDLVQLQQGGCVRNALSWTDGESRLEQVKQSSGRGREILNEGEEKKVQEESDSGGSEETQEYLQEAKSMEYEEEEERTFVPSAVRVPLKRVF